MTVNFTVPGPPRGKERPRFKRVGKFTTTYTPEKTVEYEEKVKVAYNKDNRGEFLIGPLIVDIEGVFPIPKSVSKKRREELIGEPHMKKPDCDNVAKIILDPLNNLAYHDDGQVAKLAVAKVYGENPEVRVSISEIDIRLESDNPNCPIYYIKKREV